MKRGNIAAALLPTAAALMTHCCRRTAADANAVLPPSCHLCRRRLRLFVVVVVVSIAIAAAAFSWLLIDGSAPTIAVAAGIFVATVAEHGGSAAPAALLPPLMLRCRQTFAAAAKPAAAGVLPALLPPLMLRCRQTSAAAAKLAATGVLPAQPPISTKYVCVRV
jgi:hypothetical protein